MAAVFVAGCLMIKTLSRWADHITQALGFLFGTVVVLLVVTWVAQHAPRQPMASSRPVATAAALYGGESLTAQVEAARGHRSLQGAPVTSSN